MSNLNHVTPNNLPEINTPYLLLWMFFAVRKCSKGHCLSFSDTLIPIRIIPFSTNIYGLFYCTAYHVTQISMSKSVNVYRDDYKLVSCNEAND